MSASGHHIQVNERQRGNPVLAEMRNVPWQFTKGLIPDYVFNASSCCLFISVRYHLLKPAYLAKRLAELKRDWRLRVLLCYVDIDDNTKPIHDLNIAAVKHECTLILAHSTRECARILECFKAYENNDGRAIKEKVDKDHMSQVTDALTSIKPVNRSDVTTLMRTFGNLKGIIEAPLSELKSCPGLGDKKVKRLHDAFHALDGVSGTYQPFSLAARRRRNEKRRREAADADAARDVAQAQDDEIERAGLDDDDFDDLDD